MNPALPTSRVPSNMAQSLELVIHANIAMYQLYSSGQKRYSERGLIPALPLTLQGTYTSVSHLKNKNNIYPDFLLAYFKDNI